MPRNQVANVGVFDFGAPVTTGTVLEFRVKKGGMLSMRFESAEQSTTTITVSAEVSVDGSAWTALNYDVTGTPTALTSMDVVAKGQRDFGGILLKTPTMDGSTPVGDHYMRITASGSARGNVQMRGDENLQIEVI